MAIKVKIKKKVPKLEFKDYAWPGEKPAKITAVVAGWIAAIAPVGIIAALSPQWGISMGSWLLLALLTLAVVKSREPKMLRKLPLKHKVLRTNHQDLHEMIADAAARFGLEPPDTYVMEDEDPGRVFAISPKLMVISAKMRDVISPQELHCAILMEMAHIHCKHVKTRYTLQVFKQLPGAVRGFCWFASVWAYFLELNWVESMTLTVDRLTTLYLRHPRLVTSTVLKLSIEADPLAQVDSKEVDEYLQTRHKMQATTSEVSQHFKMGSTLHSNPFLNERVREIIEFTHSDRFGELCDLLDKSVQAGPPSKKKKRGKQ